MFSTWDLVRPRYWYPMFTLEQSMMELDMADRMFAPVHPAFSPFGRGTIMAPPSLLRDRVAGFPFHDDDEDDFFRDLPKMRPRKPEEQQQERQKKIQPTGVQSEAHDQEQHAIAQANAQSAPASTTNDDGQGNADTSRGFSSYSFSSSSVLDDKGRRVTSTRRRYEDSTGRLKALHERAVDGKKLRTMWSRQHKDDEGVHKSVCSGGSAEEFEEMWASTPFGEAQTKSMEGGDARKEDASEPTKKLEVPKEKNEAGEVMEQDKP